MALKGGYQIVDLKGTKFTAGTGKIINGAYAAAKSTCRTVISGFTIGTTPYPDTEVCLTIASGIYGGFVTINYPGTGASATAVFVSIGEDDSVTFNTKTITVA